MRERGEEGREIRGEDIDMDRMRRERDGDIDCLKWLCWIRLWTISLFEGFNHVKYIGVLICDMFVSGFLWCSI